MIVTTTNSNLPIAANVVIGTTVFSDIGASYVDFFFIGGLIGEVAGYFNGRTAGETVYNKDVTKGV